MVCGLMEIRVTPCFFSTSSFSLVILSGLPASIAVFSKNGISSTIRISKMKTGVNQPDSYFVFNEKDYPDAEIIDLR